MPSAPPRPSASAAHSPAPIAMSDSAFRRAPSDCAIIGASSSGSVSSGESCFTVGRAFSSAGSTASCDTAKASAAFSDAVYSARRLAKSEEKRSFSGTAASSLTAISCPVSERRAFSAF